MARLYLMVGGLCGLLSIALGAFGAHALENRLSEAALATYHTGVQYQMYHALALILLALLAASGRVKAGRIRWAGVFFMLGIVLFCGSLYVISLSGITTFGMIAPFGGVSFILGWLMIAMSAGDFAKNT